jgi:hypothetical protein
MGMKTMLLKSALAHSISTLAETMKDVVQDSFEDVARNVGRWARGTAILYGIGAALALVALVALCLGLGELLAAAGLPLFASYLIVATVAGVTGFLLFKAGARRRVRPGPRGEPERSAFRIRIGPPPVTRRSRRRIVGVRRARPGGELRGSRPDRRAARSRRGALRAARRSGREVIPVPDGRTPRS